MSITRVDGGSKGAGLAAGAAKALVKGLGLIEALATAASPLRPGRLAEVVGMPRPTVQRLLDVLVAEDVLQGNADVGFALGPRLAVWGQAYLGSLDVRLQATDLMRRLAEETRETCFLGVRENHQVLYVEKADGPQAVRPAAFVGARNPLHSTAIGKVLLSWSPAEVIREYTAGRLAARTPNTITQRARLLKELQTIRLRGFAIDDVENEEGVRCVAAPIRDHRGDVVAAMSVSAPAYRFSLQDLQRLAPRVLSVSEELSTRCGYRGDAAPPRKSAGKQRTSR